MIGYTETMVPGPTIEAFDHYLASIGLRFEAVVISGSALVLLGIASRATRNEDWPSHVHDVVAKTGEILGHGA